MIEYFRENESARKTFLWIITILLCAGFGLNQHNNQQSYQLGKRHINTDYIRHRLSNSNISSPEQQQQLQSALIAQQVKQLTHFAELERLGIKPSIQSMQQHISAQFGGKKEFNEYLTQSRSSKNEVMLRLSDSLAQQQFYSAIQVSNIEPPQDSFLTSHTAGQIRHGVHLNLSEARFTLSSDELDELYQRHKHHLVSEPEYHYQYINLSPTALNISPPSDQTLQEYLEQHIDHYTDFKVAFTLTTLQPHKKGNRFEQELHGPTDELIGSYIAQHPSIKSTIVKKNGIRSKIDAKLLAQLERVSIGESVAYMKNKSLIILTLNEKQATQTLDPLKKDALIQDCYADHERNQQQAMLQQIGEYAYTHPTSLHELAGHFNLKVEKGITSEPSETLLNTFNNPEINRDGYISDIIEDEQNNTMILQLTNVTPPKELSPNAALPKLYDIYKNRILIPKLTHMLSKCASHSEIQDTVKPYGLSISSISSEQPNSVLEYNLFNLTRKRSNPNPSTTINLNDQHIWLTLSDIEYSTPKFTQPMIADEEHAHYIDSIR